MPRQLRIEYPGPIYHLMNRGDRREPIFHKASVLVLTGIGQELLAQAHTRAGDERVTKLQMKPDEQNEFKLE